MQVLGLIKETEASYVSSEDEHSTILIDMSQLGDEPQQLPAGVQLGIKDSDGNIRMMELVGDGNRDVMIVRESGGKDGDVEGRGMGVVVRGVGENQGLRHSPRKRKRRSFEDFDTGDAEEEEEEEEDEEEEDGDGEDECKVKAAANLVRLHSERLIIEKKRLAIEDRRLAIEEKRLQVEERRLELEERRMLLMERQGMDGVQIIQVSEEGAV